MHRAHVFVVAALTVAGCSDLFFEQHAFELGEPCSTDRQCPTGTFCVEGVCCERDCDRTGCSSCLAEKNGVADGLCLPIHALELGGPCSTNCQCPTGTFCVEGVCCERDCYARRCASCLAVKNGVADGLCLPIPEGEDPYDECPGVIGCNGSLACQTCSDVPEFTTCGETRKCAGGRCTALDCGTYLCNTAGPGFLLADTNQRACFDGTGTIVDCSACDPYCGQDAEYGWDTQFAKTDRFVRTAGVEPVVTDRVTGLEWRGCFDSQSGTDCSEGAGEPLSWEAAVRLCADDAWAGGGWRLPDFYELQSIVDLGRAAPPTIDTGAFPGAMAAPVWTASGSFYDIRWVVDFADGRVDLPDASSPSHVACVRGGRTPLAELRWQVREEVASDRRTGLDWSRCAGDLGENGTTCHVTFTSWQSALSHCEALELDGYTNWRLPSRVELTSIVNTRLPGSIDLAVFSRMLYRPVWSSTSVAQDPAEAWVVDFSLGTSSGLDKDDSAAVHCVRTKL